MKAVMPLNCSLCEVELQMWSERVKAWQAGALCPGKPVLGVVGKGAGLMGILWQRRSWGGWARSSARKLVSQQSSSAEKKRVKSI